MDAGDTRVDDRDPLLADAELLHRVVRSVLGDRQDLMSRADQAEAGHPGDPHVSPLGDVAVVHDHRDQVIQRDHQAGSGVSDPGRPDVVEVHRHLEGRHHVVDARDWPVRRSRPAVPGEQARPHQRLHRGRDGRIPLEADRPDRLGGEVHQRTGVLRYVAGNPAFAVGRTLGPPSVEPDGARCQAHLSRDADWTSPRRIARAMLRDDREARAARRARPRSSTAAHRGHGARCRGR